MTLHNDMAAFRQTILSASAQLQVIPVFLEKDYWITVLLSRLAGSKYAASTVFKGGTSLSKGFGIINRFSEDVDIAIINDGNKSGNEIKTIIRTVEKEMTKGLKELQVSGTTSKGSRFRKAVYAYESMNTGNIANQLIVEVNSFANPFPYQPLIIKLMLYDFLVQTGNTDYIAKYNLQPFILNVLNKEQTLLEKLVSLIRFSFTENVTAGIGNKVRHFYDLFFLAKDADCKIFIQSKEFKKQFTDILNHDKDIFDEPAGWKEKAVKESPLINNFEKIWRTVKEVYKTELAALAFTAIPDEKEVAESFVKLTNMIQ